MKRLAKYKDIIHSPSSLKTYMTCPYKYKGTYLTKEVRWKQSPQAKRGEELHKLMEGVSYKNWDQIGQYWTDELSRPHAEGFVNVITQLKKAGWTIKTEVECGTDEKGKMIYEHFFDDPSYVRCRIDFLAVRQATDYAIVLDWKTGKKYDIDTLQLQVNAFCLRPLLGVEKFVMGFAYLDQGGVANHSVDLTGVDMSERQPAAIALSPCSEALIAFRDVEEALATDKFPPVKNFFCQWCQVESCPLKLAKVV